MGNADVIRIDEHRVESSRCGARTADGRPCRNKAGENGYCRRHKPEQVAERSVFELHAERMLGFLRRRVTGSYPTDDFGFDRDLTESVVIPMLRPLFDHWFRVEQRGVQNLPSTGPVLLVCNHSGVLPWDALMLKVGVLDVTGRHCRVLSPDLPFRIPVVGEMTRKTGDTLACDADATRMLDAGELVAAFPEGFRGLGKPFRERYKLQRFGREGFVDVAVKTGTPIVPVAIIGAEEAHPMLTNLRPLARVLGLPYVPVTPTFPMLGPLGALPLPSRITIEYGEPVETASFTPDAAMDPMFVFNLTDEVRESIQQMLYKNLMGRRSVFF